MATATKDQPGSEFGSTWALALASVLVLALALAMALHLALWIVHQCMSHRCGGQNCLYWNKIRLSNDNSGGCATKGEMSARPF